MGRLLIAAILMVFIMVALISSASSGFINHVADLSRKGRLLLVAVLCLALWAGWLLYDGGADYLIWLRNVPARPADEREFVSLIERALHAWSAEQDPRERDRNCLIQSREIAESAARVSDWTGTVSTAYQLGTRVVLVVQIGRYANVRTSYNIAADAIMIDRGTTVYEQAAGLQSGDPVRFSGSPVINAAHCIFDLGAREADQRADVLFKFTSIERAKQ
jgi:hypothetical protein